MKTRHVRGAAAGKENGCFPTLSREIKTPQLGSRCFLRTDRKDLPEENPGCCADVEWSASTRTDTHVLTGGREDDDSLAIPRWAT